MATDPFGGLSPLQWAEGANDAIENYTNNIGNENKDNNLLDSEPQPTLSDFFKDNPEASYEDAMKYMSEHSEEWAEKYLDYLTEKGELDRANEYTASREDTAYQRLVQDLKNAGLNPAMMYGSSASPSASGSQGYVKMSEGATSRGVSNYTKLKNIILQYMLYQLKHDLGAANSVFKGISSISQVLSAFLPG